MTTLPESTSRYPFEGAGIDVNVKETIFLKNAVTRTNIIVGDFTYYHAPDTDDFENRNVLYHFPNSKERLIIGNFCGIATGTKFIMSFANHKMDGFSTYPFWFIFRHGWKDGFDMTLHPSKGDTVVGNDVWFGYDATIMPGVTIGDGAIIGAKAVVTKDVPPYSIAAGNPAKIIRTRFDDKTIAELQAIAWWNWSREKIARNIPAIIGNDLDALKNAK